MGGCPHLNILNRAHFQKMTIFYYLVERLMECLNAEWWWGGVGAWEPLLLVRRRREASCLYWYKFVGVVLLHLLLPLVERKVDCEGSSKVNVIQEGDTCWYGEEERLLVYTGINLLELFCCTYCYH